MAGVPFLPKLDALRSRIRMFLIFQGIVYVLFALLVAVLLDLGIDRLLRLHVSQRVLLTLAVTAGIVIVTFRFLWKPSELTLSDEDVAVLIEHRNPQLADRMISVLQYERMIAAGSPMSRQLVNKVKEEAGELTSPLQVGDLIDGERLRQLMLFGAGVVAVAALAGALIPGDTWKTWFERNVMMSSTAEWPYRSRVKLEGFTDGVAKVAHGDAFPLTVTALRERADGTAYAIPESVTISYRFGDGRWQSVTVVGTDGSYRYPLGQLYRQVELQVTGGDYRSPIHRITIADRPELTLARLEIVPPSYTRAAGDPDQIAKEAAGRVPVLAGSKVTFVGKSSKPLESVQLTRGARKLKATIDDDKLTFRCELSTEKSGLPSNIKVQLQDHEDVTNRGAAAFNMIVEPDALPLIKAKPTGIGDRITRWARIPIEVEVRDRYGLGEVRLRYELHRRDKEKTVVKGVLSQVKRALPGAKRFPKGRIYLDLEKEFERRRQTEPDLAPPAPGQRLKVFIEATDFADSVDGKPRVAVFPPQGFHFAIVADTALSKHLLGMQKRIRRQYSALLDREKAVQWILMRTRAKAERGLDDARQVRSLFNSLDKDKDGTITLAEYGDDNKFKDLDGNKDGVLTPADFGADWRLDTDGATQLDQQGTEQRRILRAGLRLAAGLEQIREEMENNRLDREGKSREKLERKVIKPMKQLADREMTNLAASLERASRLVDQQPLAEIETSIDLSMRIILAMGEILKEMAWSELFDDVVTRLREVLRLEQELKRLTEDAHRVKISNLLPDDDDGDDDDDDDKGGDE